MRILRWILMFAMVLPVAAQVINPSIVPVTVAPSGVCAQVVPIELLTPDGTLYTCQNGTWSVVGGGSGTFTTLSKDAISTSTGGSTTVVGLNGTLLSGLATGILKNTTGTGVPSIAVAGTDYVTPAGLASYAPLASPTFTGAATFAASGIRLLGSSTGYTTFASGNAGASNFTINFPASTDTVAYVALAQTFTNKTLTSPIMTAPALGTPASGVITNLTGTCASCSVGGNAATATVSSGLSGSPTTGQYWGYNGTAQGWYTPTGSGTVNSGSGYALAAYGSSASTAVSPATGIKTDSTGNNLIVPGSVTSGGSTADPTTATGSGIGACTEAATAGTPTAGHDYYRCDSTSHKLVASFNGGSEYGLTQVISSGQTSMPTAAVSANSCSASATTATATGAATTDAIEVTYASDPTGVTGYGGGTSGGITVRTWPTANTINFKLCNETGSSITPGSLSINWRVVR